MDENQNLHVGFLRRERDENFKEISLQKLKEYKKLQKQLQERSEYLHNYVQKQGEKKKLMISQSEKEMMDQLIQLSKEEQANLKNQLEDQLKEKEQIQMELEQEKMDKLKLLEIMENNQLQLVDQFIAFQVREKLISIWQMMIQII
ncbi:hypothetical protein PPERSA_06140 [Pseudocohnilembus persalinus]|uniref:Uncharacterized protein n=1 Tax=Pseudocohnilembus persalinus TaxID=266149 RepID=A0A0V0QVK5_PSEPJ|nr:hypothetical protein PPERSA_06140 [Pseudocohnilembus persalinus]|eukprot:KRX06258.1 hypothetical protein PPERSA_06140 [Pseudocohnilembus persalinus]